MLGIFLTAYFQFEERFDFRFICVMNARRLSSVFAFPGIKETKLSWKSHGILLSVSPAVRFG